MSLSNLNLCRICLENEAKVPIFGTHTGAKNDKVINLLKSCTNIEIADIAGYPRSICVQCNSLVEAAYELINKFLKANIILNSNLSSVKQEKMIDGGDYNTEFAIDTIKLKEESDLIQESKNKKKCDPIFEIHLPTKFEDASDSTKSDDEETLQDIKNNKMCRSEQIERPIVLSKVKTERIVKKKQKSKTGKLKTKSKVKQEKDIKTITKNVKRESNKLVENKKLLEKSNLCEHCGLALKTKDMLAIHILKYHSEKLYCPECPYTNHSKKNLSMHIKRNHCEKTEKCSQCGNSFAILNDLKNHILKVHGKKKEKKMYDCQYCDAKLTKPYLKVMHERTAHTAFLKGLMSK